ncbi:MAG: GTP-binding protein [Bacteroidales bacterium]|nr:GTP-binding protein [Bacteroidales bacterium]
MKPIPLYLVSGFLGSGKTTLLKIIIDRLSNKRKIGIILNDFLVSGIDSGLDRYGRSGFCLLELNRGDVACISENDYFSDKLISFIKNEQPSLIFLETSGLSSTINIIKALDSPELHDLIYFSKSYMVIDSSRFDHEVSSIRRLRDQIRFADTIIINKYDKLNRLLSPEDILKSYNYLRIKDWILQKNPFATIFPTIYSHIPETELDFVAYESSGLYSKEASPQTKVISSDKSFDSVNIPALRKLLESSRKARGYLITDSREVFALIAHSGIVDFIPCKHNSGRSEIIVSGDSDNISSVIKLFS